MKKFVAILLAFAMLLSVAAFAEETVPSPKPNVQFEGAFNIEQDKDQSISDEELPKLLDVGPDEYFGVAAEEAKAYIGVDDLDVLEFVKVIAYGYEEEMGDVEFKITQPLTQPSYEVGEKFGIMFGFLNGDAYDWNFIEGTCVEEDSINVTIPAELCEELVAREDAMFAIVR